LAWFNNLSFSPLALVNASSSIFCINTLVDESSIFGHVSWGTEVVIWDQISSIAPCTDINVAVALVFTCLGDALGPGIIVDFVISILDWVAELLGEEWHWFA
jgi:hypothetical protein